MAKKQQKKGKGFLTTDCVAVDNRRARHDYLIEDDYEAGIVLVGTEVKSLRTGQANLTDAYAEFGKRDDELWLLNAYIPEYNKAVIGGHHATRRPRKLLLHKRELNKLMGKIQRQGYTLIPLDIHFNDKGLAKVKLGLAKGKSKYDKRQAEKDKEWRRQKSDLKNM